MRKKKAQPTKNQLKKEQPKSKKKSPKKPISFRISFLKNEGFKHISGLLILLFSAYLFVAFISHFFSGIADFDINSMNNIDLKERLQIKNIGGFWGTKLSYFFINKGFGFSALLILFPSLLIGWKLLTNMDVFSIPKSIGHTLIGLFWISVSAAFFLPDNALLSGHFGYYTNLLLKSYIGGIGTFFLIAFTLGAWLISNFKLKIPQSLRPISMPKTASADQEEETSMEETEEEAFVDQAEVEDIAAGLELKTDNEPETLNSEIIDETPAEQELEFELEHTNEIQETETNDAHELDIEIPTGSNGHGSEDEVTTSAIATGELEISVEKPLVEQAVEHHGLDEEYDPKLDLRDFKQPTIDLLIEHGSNQINVEREELEENKHKIINTLNNYNIQIQKIKATIGPTITLYEIVPAPGIRINKIKNLEDDIALSLSALGIRIIAPMPGKGTIGIEVPNKKPEIVAMKTILASDKFNNNSYELPIGLGKTISNESFVTDLAKMPHLLVAGATGQGKSVGLNAILASLLYKKHPATMKLVLVDPKKVELSLFNKIERHYLAKLPDAEDAIITDVRKVVRTLNSLCVEMDTRYELLKNAYVRNIKEYNAKFKARKLNPNDGHRFLPYIVLVVDEFADLIMTAGKEVELPIARLAQLARAIGIHLIIATQRPSVNIITGTIKANFPARIAFRVTSKIDSRTILDAGGAEQLIGRGDMLLSTGNDLTRLQCAFIDTPEVDDICDFIGQQRGYLDAYHLPEVPDEETDGVKDVDLSDRDALFEDAARLLVASQQGSTSMLQRKLKLGYNRAGRIIDQLEAAGVVGPFEGSKAREVLIKDEMSLEQLLKEM